MAPGSSIETFGTLTPLRRRPLNKVASGSSDPADDGLVGLGLLAKPWCPCIARQREDDLVGSRSETPASMAAGAQIQVAFAAKASEHRRVLGIFGHRQGAFRSVGDVEHRSARRALEGELVGAQKA